MDYLVKESTDSKKYVNPEKYDIPFKQDDFYYVSNKFKDVSLNKSDCDALNANPSFNDPNYCKTVLSNPSSSQETIGQCFQKALCDNKSTAIELIQNAGKKNSSLQNENDHTSFFNVEVLHKIHKAIITTEKITNFITFYFMAFIT